MSGRWSGAAICKPSPVTSTQTRGERPANALSTRPFRFLWFTNIAFFLVVNAERFVFGWLVLDGLDLGEGQQGLVVFALGLPSALLVLQAGVWADRWDRRRMLLATQIAGGVVMAGTAIMVGLGQIGFGWILVAALVSGSAAAIGSPVRSSLIPALVPREQLFGAIAINAIAMTLSLIAGPVIAKLVGDQFGFAGAFWFQAMLMFVGVLFLMRVDVPPHEFVPQRRSVVAETKDAVRHVLDDTALKTLFGLLLLASLTVNPAVMVTMQAHVKGELGRTAGAAALPLGLLGVGMALSSVVIMRKGDMARKGALFQRAMISGGAMTVLIGLSNSYVQVLVLSFVVGLGGGFFINMNQGLIQANTPQPMMGRVMGLFTLVAAGVMPVGALLLGALATAIGSGNAISVAGAVALGISATVYVRNAELRDLD